KVYSHPVCLAISAVLSLLYHHCYSLQKTKSRLLTLISTVVHAEFATFWLCFEQAEWTRPRKRLGCEVNFLSTVSVLGYVAGIKKFETHRIQFWESYKKKKTSLGFFCEGHIFAKELVKGIFYSSWKTIREDFLVSLLQKSAKEMQAVHFAWWSKKKLRSIVLCVAYRPEYCPLKISKPPLSYVKVRSYKNYDSQCFVSHLERVPWNEVVLVDDASD
ncbi:hypothetical protein pdam_00021548, partial [Pocillopora damicornis]